MNADKAFNLITNWVGEPQNWHPRVRYAARVTFPLSVIVHMAFGVITVATGMVAAVLVAVFWSFPKALLDMYDDPEPPTPHDDGFGGL